jgi:pilus assembly protein CpaB
MAVEVDSVVGVAGFVQPGDYVDVITLMSPDEETKKSLNIVADKIAKIVLQNIKVLAVGVHLSTEGRDPVTVNVVTLAVTADQSERLALGSRHGRILLTIRPRTDQEIEATAGVTPVNLLAPDDGAQLVTAREREREPITRRVVVYRHPKKEEAPPPPAAPVAPTVEIIRGNRVEERKLRSYEVPTK